MVRLYHPERRGLGTVLTGPAIRHLDEVKEVAPYFFEALVACIAASEIFRCIKGWENPYPGGASSSELKMFSLRPDYYPGGSFFLYYYWRFLWNRNDH